METLGPGALFRIGDEHFEFEGTTPSPDNPDEEQIVGRLNPEKPVAEGAIHRVFSPTRMREAIRVGSFGETLPYINYVKEKAVWQGLFGPEVNVPYPPRALVDAIESARKEGIDSFEPHYLPPMAFTKEQIALGDKKIDYPDSWVKLQNNFWELVAHTSNADKKNALQMEGGWVLLDTSLKPEARLEEYPGDTLAPLISRANNGDPTRLALLDDKFARIFKEIANITHVNPSQVRHLKTLEFNTLGNLFHPELAQSPAHERFNDVMQSVRRGITGSTPDIYFMGGGSDTMGPGLSRTAMWLPSSLVMTAGSAPTLKNGFRPIITFPDQSSRGGMFSRR